MDPADFNSTNFFELMRPRKVCLCNSVSESDLVESIKKGNTTLPMLMQDTKCCTNCGTCVRAVRRILERELAKVK